MRSFSAHLAVGAPATLRLERSDRQTRLLLTGDWLVAEAARMDEALRTMNLPAAGETAINGLKINRLDSAGAWLILRTKRDLEAKGGRVVNVELPGSYRALYERLERETAATVAIHPPPPALRDFLERLGRGTMHVLRQTYDLVGFLGRVTVETWEAVLAPRRELPLPAFVQQLEETGLSALPIVGMLAFLLGIVLAYQGADQLKFSAQIYTIDFLGVGFLRELGGLVTAIIVAGRSGSAFTAQIGTMRVNEETDAMQTIGLNIAEILVLPRVLGLVIALPLLTFYADIVGLIGGMVMTYLDLGITFPAFMRELESAITLKTLLVGLVKAPVFAFVIALVGCFEGLRVERNAGSVGRLTTRSVVESIFLIIALDAGFSVLFSVLGI